MSTDEREIDYDPNLNDAMLRVYDLQRLASFLEDHGVRNGMPKEVVDFLIQNTMKEAEDIGDQIAPLVKAHLEQENMEEGFERLPSGNE